MRRLRKAIDTFCMSAAVAMILMVPQPEHGDHDDMDECNHGCYHAYGECVEPCKDKPGEESNRCVMSCVREHHGCLCDCGGQEC